MKVAKENPLSTYKPSKSFDENFNNNPFFRPFILAHIKKLHPEAFATVDAKYAPEIEKLKEQINLL